MNLNESHNINKSTCYYAKQKEFHVNNKSLDIENFVYKKIHTWRVVCDSMLGGLTNKLRMCGCDCVHFAFDQGGERSVKLAMREKRVFLTRNKGYLKVSSIFLINLNNIINYYFNIIYSFLFYLHSFYNTYHLKIAILYCLTLLMNN